MIDLRFIRRDESFVLQWRRVHCQIGWSKGDDHPVIQPRSPISLIAEKNWTPWSDVPFEFEPEEKRGSQS